MFLRDRLETTSPLTGLCSGGDGGRDGEISKSAVYASLDSTDPNRMVVIAINRFNTEQVAAISLTYDRVFDHAEVYLLTQIGGASPRRIADVELDQINAFNYSMPGYSVTTLVFIADGLPGDFNHDGVVDSADYNVWQNSFGQTGNLDADVNEDNIVDAADYTLWRDNLGRSDIGGLRPMRRPSSRKRRAG